MESVTQSGLVVMGGTRAVPRDNPPNDNPPLGSVGPNVPQGFGDVHVMYDANNPPTAVQAWQGWPTEWATPLWNGASAAHLVTTLWTCVDLNTRQLATMPTYGMKGLEMFVLPEWSNNPEPGTYASSVEAWQQVFNTLQVDGECLLWCVGRYANGTVARYIVLNPAWVNIERANGSVAYEMGGKELDPKDVLHIKYQSWPGNLRGIGPLTWAAGSIVSAVALEKYTANLASNGGIPWAVIKTQRHLNGTDAEKLQQRWVTAARARNGAPAILSGGIELETLTVNPRDMALLEMRVFDETRIASALGCPPYLVGLPQPEGLTYNNGQALFDFHWRATLRAMAVNVASAISGWALPRGQRMEFNRDAYVQPDPESRARTYQTMFNIVDEKGNRAITVDEIRMAERLLPNQPTPELEASTEMSVA